MEGSNSRHDSDKMLPSLYSIFKGEVASLQTYGVFVRIPGCRKNGLVHKTQISKMRVDNPSEVLEVGDNVYCKVISLGEAGEDKISLSMKVVNQDNGKDLDQNLVVTKQEEQRRKKGLPPVQNKIELGAILNTVCRKCGTTGHLTIDCFKLPGDKTYDLVPELDLDSMVQPLVESGGKDKKKKKKKDKHQKKQKKRRPTSKDVESSSEEERREGKGNWEKKKKRKKKMDSSEDTSESSSGEEVARPNRRNETDKKKHRKSDWRHEDIQMRGRGHSSEHKSKSSTASEEQSRDRRGKKRDHSIRDDDNDRWQEKHYKSSSKHHGSSKYDEQTDEHKRRHSDDHRYKDTYHHGDRR